MTVASRAVIMAVMTDVKTSESDEQWVVAVGQVGDTVVVAVESQTLQRVYSTFRCLREMRKAEPAVVCRLEEDKTNSIENTPKVRYH